MFGADGRLYVSSGEMGEVIRYAALTGAFIDIFVEEGSGGLGEPTFIIFAPQVVPEPGILALLGVGLLALAFPTALPRRLRHRFKRATANSSSETTRIHAVQNLYANAR